jgi:predicted AlkP superfamily pyrophosphatase or phosphodiesterase
VKVFAALALVVLAFCSGAASAAPKRPVIMISIDGFRADYLDRGLTPTISRLGREGVRALAMRPSFPALTYPNHYTLVTGLRPDRHGLVHNVIEDPEMPGVRFSLGAREQVRSARWWEQGEPIWVTAKKAGLKANSLFWPGDEAATHGVRPDRWLTFDQSMPAAARVDLAVEWIKRDHPDFTGLYFDDLDTAGHTFGPDSPELNAAVARVDAAIGRLLSELEIAGLAEDHFDIIVTADHGMVRADKLVMLDDIAEATARIVTTGGTATLTPLPGREAEAAAALVGRGEHMTCWLKDQIPTRYHYGANPRVAPIVCLGDLGWYLSSHAASDGKTPNKGQHGFDPFAPEMAALFVAHGPGFRSSLTLPVIDNVDVYPMVMQLLDVTARPNDGSAAVAASVLRRP